MRARTLSARAAGLVTFITAVPGAAQVTPYTVTHDFNGTYAPLPASATRHAPTAYGSQPAWDEGAVRVPLGFDFDFFGRTYDAVWAYTNGFLSFEPPPSGVTLLTAPSAVPRAGDPVDAYVAPMWADLDRDRSRTPLPPPPAILSAVTGAPGSRTFVLEWRDFKRARSQQSEANFQVQLSERTQRIRIVYGSSFGILNATAGLEGPRGRDGFELHRASSSCRARCPCGPVSCSSVPNFPSGLVVDVELPGAAELVGAVNGPPGARPGARFSAEVVARNAGLLPASAFDYEVFLSPSNQSLAGAASLGRFRASSGLAPLTARSSTASFTVPAGTPVGTRYLAVEVDTAGEVNEAFEGNNIAFGPPFNTGPDLRGTLEVPRIAGPGQPLLLGLDIENAGAPETRSFDVRFWLSADRALDAQDALLDTLTLDIPQGFRRPGPVTVQMPATAPVSPPRRYVLAEIDSAGAVAEVDESNNLVVSGDTLEVVGPELEVTGVQTASVAVRGVVFPVELAVRNRGGGAALGVTACVLLGPTSSFDLATAPFLAQTSPIDLRPGALEVLRLEPRVPPATPASDRFVAGAIDCGRSVDERDEANNVTLRASGPVRVLDPGPDWRVSQLRVPAEVVAGERVEAEVRVTNRGTATGRPELALRVSPDAAISASDPEVARVRAGSALAPGDLAEVRLSGALPTSTPAGAVHLGVVADPDAAVDEVDEADNAVVSGPVTVVGGTLAVVGPLAPPAEIGQAYVFRFSAAGGVPDRDWQIAWASGAAPPGLDFDPTSGTLSGQPAPSGEGEHGYRLTVRAGAEQASTRGRLLVVPPGLELQVLSRRLPPARRDVLYRHQLVAVGGAPPYRWQVASDALPQGLALDPETGVMSGAPALVGAYPFTVEVTDRFGRRASAAGAIDVVDPEAGLVIETAAVPDGMVGMSYSTRFLASGEMGPVTWSIEGGAPGLRLDPSTGLYTGTPTAAGVFPVVLEARETEGRGRFDRSAFVMEIVERGTLFIESPSVLPEATLGEPYSGVALRATPDEGGLVWSVIEGELPPGLSLEAGGAISGTPTAVGAYPFRVQVRNRAQEVRRGTLVVTVRDAAEPEGPSVDTGGGCRCSQVEPRPGIGIGIVGLLLVLGLRRAGGRRRRSASSAAHLG